MSLKIRLARAGTKKRPYYHVVIADARSPRDGRFIEKVGTYNPILEDKSARVSLVTERIQHWLSVGAQPTDRVARFVDAAGLKKREPRNNPSAPCRARRPPNVPRSVPSAPPTPRRPRTPPRRSCRRSGRRVSRGQRRDGQHDPDGPHRRGPRDQGRGAHPVLHRGPDGARRLRPARHQQARTDGQDSLGPHHDQRARGAARGGPPTATPPKSSTASTVRPRSVLPETDDEDDFYHADLIGLAARLTDGTEIGVVAAVPNFGADDLLEIRDPRSGDTYLYPFSKAVVPEIRIADGYLVIEPPIEAEPGEEEPD